VSERVTYTVHGVRCMNCGAGWDNLELPKGLALASKACPECECRGLAHRVPSGEPRRRGDER
jgi:hypothetical protein